MLEDAERTGNACRAVEHARPDVHGVPMLDGMRAPLVDADRADDVRPAANWLAWLACT